MNLIMSLHHEWAEKILEGFKPFEFRKKKGLLWETGQTIYIYDTSKKKISGQATIAEIRNVGTCKLGAYDFLENFAEMKDRKEGTKTLDAVIKIKLIDVPGYDNALKLSYLFLPEYLNDFRKTGNPPDIFRMTNEERRRYFSLKEKGDKFVSECDDWLSSQGFYQDCESYYKIALRLENPERYPELKNLSEFLDRNDQQIKRAPQSWMYTKS